MKRAIAVIAASFVLIAVFSGCVSGSGGETAVSPQGEADPAASYNAYAGLKSMALDNLTSAIIEKDPDLFIEAEPMLTIAGTVDSLMLPITAIGENEEALAMLESLKFNIEEIRRDGEGYIIEYKAPDGEDYVQELEYDGSLDAMHSRVIGSSGKETVWFENIKTGDGYTAQYYLSEIEDYPLVTVYADADTCALGFSAPKGKPEPLGPSVNLGIDYVKTCDSYFILQSGKLIFYQNEQTKTF